jgi:adenylyltransferase/sulfurtransferase
VNRYQRQTLLPQIGEAGQAKLAAARVLLVGCGALGTNIAEQLVRAGVGFLRLVDRDIVELTNLQRQVLFDENHAQTAWPKAAAAAERLAAINSSVTIDAQVLDVHAGNVEELAAWSPLPPVLRGERVRVRGASASNSSASQQKEPPHPNPLPRSTGGEGTRELVDLILDGTDNVSTRYLLNDVAVKHQIPWIYGACVGVEGRMLPIRPGKSPCLRCIFPSPPRPEELATCDTAGVLGSAAAVVASLQVVAAIKLLMGGQAALSDELLTLDLWSNRFHRMRLQDARRPDCTCCVLRQFEFLSRPPDESAVTLCGRDAVQIRGTGQVELNTMAARWQQLGAVEQNRYFVRCQLTEPAQTRLTLFADGRLIVQGTRDANRAKSLYARFVGA